MPKISIVIPSFNKERYIKRAINSVLFQTYSNFELIIVDSSTDRSLEIIKTFNDKRIRYFQRKKTGAAKTRNIGVGYAQSNLIAFLDADDEWTPEHLKTLVDLHNKFPSAGLVTTPYVKCLSDGTPQIMIFRDIPSPPWEGIIPNYFRTCAKGDVPINSSSCAVIKDTFWEMGGFNEKFTYGEDQHLWGRIALKFPIAFSWNGIAIYHTEAEDRICNIPHKLENDPFSQFILEEIDLNILTPELKTEINHYIKRRRITQIFGNLIYRECNASTLNNGKRVNGESIPLIQYINQKAIKFMICLITYFIKSHNYNIFRRIFCFFTRTYYPRL